MSVYIDRTPSDTTSAFVNDGTVTISTRKVGNSVAIDVLEEAPALTRPASKTVLTGLVRGAARQHVDKPRAVREPIADTEFTRDSYSVDPETGHMVNSTTRVRKLTYIVTGR